MCDCEEIQDIVFPSQCVSHAFKEGDYYYLDSEVGVYSFWHHPTNIYNATWLPRQDQLQEMVLEAFGKEAWFGGFCNSTEMLDLAFEFTCFCYDVSSAEMLEINEYAKQFTSMEQLWFAFVMKEKNNKTWDGENWSNG